MNGHHHGHGTHFQSQVPSWFDTVACRSITADTVPWNDFQLKRLFPLFATR
jgi:hypothetical protein